jgi:putative acetyltransferase
VSTVTVEDPRQPEVEAMVRAGDAYALSLYPADSCYLLSLDELAEPGVTVFIARDVDARALGMAALVDRHDGTGELKRLFVVEIGRGQGVASMIMDALEAGALARGIRLVQLETGPKQHAAIALYERRGYAVIDRFGPYVADENSLCMEARLA